MTTPPSASTQPSTAELWSMSFAMKTLQRMAAVQHDAASLQYQDTTLLIAFGNSAIATAKHNIESSSNKNQRDV